MEEIVRIKNISYSRYEQLLLRREELKKQAFQWQQKYTAEFGDLIISIFQKKLDCIRKKKTIEFCQSMLNHGENIDQEKLQEYIREQTAAFEQQLSEMLEQVAAARQGEEISQINLVRIRKIYHELAKQLHPDVNPLTRDTPVLKELWQKIQTAYRCNDLTGMEEASLLAQEALRQLKLSSIELEIPDIEEKIAEAEAEILKIRETDPYLYRFLLSDPEAVQEKKSALKEELASYEDYAFQLDERVKQLAMGGAKFIWRMN